MTVRTSTDENISFQHDKQSAAAANEPFVSEAPPVDRAIPDGDVVAVVYALLSEWQPIDEAGGNSS